jgi:hypothetical protein
MTNTSIDLSFPHAWTAEILAARPPILPARHFVYPQEVEEVEVGALEVLVRPVRLSGSPFLVTCALGFADPTTPTGVWSCPHPSWLCAVAGGYAYLINTTKPEVWHRVEYQPVLQIRPLVKHSLLLFAGHIALTAWGPNGKAWQSGRLSWEGITLGQIKDHTLTGTGWDLMTDREIEFQLDLRTGLHTGGVGRDAQRKDPRLP